ncbi:MAG: DUF1993 domain-containing protein [Myxococcota bacterium]|nr:DUF1993 domain-containing protein [Myxococcota bacterium]
MSLYAEIVPPMAKMLANLDAWLDKAVVQAEAKKFDPAVLVQARLAPDQFPLVKQIQAACDQTKFAAARVAGKEPPKNADTEQTIEELKARIRGAREYLATYRAEDFEGAESRVIPLFFAPGMAMAAPDFAREYALPNFYFHAMTAYAILRHNGVDLGKRDYISGLTMREA